MKLIPMTDFVLEQNKINKTSFKTYEEIIKYAEFLRQPLTREMFMQEAYYEYSELIESNSKVLFKNSMPIGNNHFEIKSKDEIILIGIGFKNGVYKTIEDLANKFKTIELTDIATKRIFG